MTKIESVLQTEAACHLLRKLLLRGGMGDISCHGQTAGTNM